jgi:ComEC/Rec2-related protein
MRITKKFTQILDRERDDLCLWAPVLFGFGAAFYFKFLENFITFIVLFLAAIFFIFLNRNSLKSLIFIACALFLSGSLYGDFYQKFFLSRTEITGKVYVDAVGKVESIRKFSNPINHLEGLNLVITEPILQRVKFVEKEKKLKTKKFSKVKKSTKSKKNKKKKSPKKISEKYIEKNFLNLKNYQEIDRRFLDYSKNYQQVEWLKIKEGAGVKEEFPNPPKKISVNLIKNFQEISVNDKITARLLLMPPKNKEFPDDFDFEFDAKAKKIGAYGFVLGEVKILEKVQISSLDEWFDSYREKIRTKISSQLQGDEAAIVLAFLIGDQSQISKNLMLDVRNSGLAHLLSISGFHLSLAGAIFFISTRFLLSRSEYLTLNFDLKKIAAIAAIFATYFYLKIADSPLPAQRAFFMVLLALIALFLDEKANVKRIIMAAALMLILFNPLSIFNVSFQLSFVAILVLATFHENFSKIVKKNFSQNFLSKFLWYFLEIVFLSIILQIATLPFLMHSFRSFALLGFIANILAIPLASFFIMPLGFLSLFLMPLGLEKFPLIFMQEGIFLIEKIIFFTAHLDYSHFVSPQLSSLGLVIAIFGLLLICLTKSELRFLGLVFFYFLLRQFF